MQKPFFQTISSRSACWVLALGTLVLYAPALFFQFIYYDDNEYVFENAHILGGLSLDFFKWFGTACVSANWHPLTLLSHAIDVQLYGTWAGGHHLTSILFHTANSLLIFFLFQRMTRSAWKSFFIAAIFAWHPVKIESVAWIAERKDVLSTFFALGAMLAYAAYVQAPQTKRKLFVACGVLFALSLMSKPMFVSLPIILLLFDFWPLQRKDKSWIDLVIEKTPLIVLSALSCFMALKYQSQGGAIQTFTNFPIQVRVANIAQAYFDYLVLFFWPVKLSIFYPYTPNAHVGYSLITALGLAGITVFLFIKRAVFPAIWVGWCLFGICLLPVIGIVKLGSHWIACRYLYWPSVGITLLLLWGGEMLIQKIPPLKKPLLAVLVIMILGWGFASTRYLEKWQNSYELFSHAEKTIPNNWVAHINLRAAYGRDGNHEKAAEHYLEAMKIFPRVTQRIKPHWLDFYYMGKVHWRRGQVPQAESFFKEAARIIALSSEDQIHPDTAREREILENCLVAIKSNRLENCSF